MLNGPDPGRNDLQPPDASTEFDRTTRIQPQGDGTSGRFDVELGEGWSSLIGVHGGYLAAIAVRGAEAVVADRPVRTLTTSFLRPGRVGPATLAVDEVRHGRSITTLVAELYQDERLLTTTRLTLVAEQGGLEWASPDVDVIAAPEDCVAVQPLPGVAHFEQAEGVLDPAGVPFTGGDRARVAGYIRPLGNRPVDAAWLAMAVDWFPPPAFVRVDPPTGGVSVDLTTHIHRPRPRNTDQGWLAASFGVETSTGGLAVEHGWIAEPDGALIAESFHTRWTALR